MSRARALARTFRWRKLLDRSTYLTLKEITTKEKIDPSYVGDVLRLTLLAPDIIEMILNGRPPPSCSSSSYASRFHSNGRLTIRHLPWVICQRRSLDDRFNSEKSR